MRAISAAVGINSAKGWYPAGSDLCLCLLCGHVEPSEVLWAALKPSLEYDQREQLEAVASPSGRVSPLRAEGVTGVFAAASIRKRGSEICVATEAPESTPSGRTWLRSQWQHQGIYKELRPLSYQSI